MNPVGEIVCPVGRSGPSGIQLLGTAFAVGPRHMATAFHVVGPSDENLHIVLPRPGATSTYQDTTDASVQSSPVRIYAADPIRDLCVLEFEVPNALVRFEYGLGGTDSTPPGSPVVTVGYPHANFGRMVLTEHHARVGARVLIGNSGEKSKHIVLNTQAREGQSGGPVFNSDFTQVVAVLLGSYAPGGGGAISLGGIDPATLHQTTHAVSAEYLQGML